jgi:hypothetical protein
MDKVKTIKQLVGSWIEYRELGFDDNQIYIYLHESLLQEAGISNVEARNVLQEVKNALMNKVYFDHHLKNQLPM